MSAMLSPLAREVAPMSTAVITRPPRRSMAASNDMRVLVLGSKNRLAMILPSQTSDCPPIDSAILSATENTASTSSLDRSSMVTTLLPARLMTPPCCHLVLRRLFACRLCRSSTHDHNLIPPIHFRDPH